MNKGLLILGTGFIGSRIHEVLGCDVSAAMISSYADANAQIKKFKPRLIVNCIGFTGRNVDECESDIDQTLMANTFVPLFLAEAALRNNVRLVHISSGCIYHYDYSRDLPIREDKVPDFFELYYSRTKIYAEQPINILAKKYPLLIVRIRIPLDNRPHQKNILSKLLNYKKVIDLPNSITYIPDFIQTLRYLIEIEAKGIYNVVNKGTLRYPELLDVYSRYVPDFKYTVIDYQGLKLVRTNLILSTEKLEQAGFRNRDIHDCLEECVCQYLKSS